MDGRQKGLLAVAAACGLGTTVFAFMALQSAGDPVHEPAPPRTILAASDELPANIPLDAVEDIMELDIPADAEFDALYALAVKPEERFTLQGRRLNRPVPTHGPILTSDLVELIDLDLAVGKMAMSISVSGANGLSGLLVPGDRVDLLVTIPERSDAPAPPSGDSDSADGYLRMLLGGMRTADSWRAEVIARDLKVLAIGQSLSRSRVQFELAYAGIDQAPPSGDAVTLEITEVQARTILEKSGAGTFPITLLLRAKAARSP